jgi:hypothetical protein
MTVVGCDDYDWYLFTDGAELYLEVFCSHGPPDYCFLMKLSEEEMAAYRLAGRSSIVSLAQAVRDSGPSVVGTKSSYAGRNVMAEKVDAVIQAVRKYRGNVT